MLLEKHAQVRRHYLTPSFRLSMAVFRLSALRSLHGSRHVYAMFCMSAEEWTEAGAGFCEGSQLAMECGIQVKEQMMKRVISVLLVVVLAAAGFLGGRWYLYVTNTSDPLDEVGIELNSRMPGPLNAWGCAQLKLNFADRLPPYGCGAGDGTQWK